MLCLFIHQVGCGRAEMRSGMRPPEASEPYLVGHVAQVTRGGKQVYLGTFATAEEAALCIALPPQGRAAAQRAAAAAPLTSEEARQQARAGELTQLVALLVNEEEEDSAEGSGYNF